MTNRLTTFIPAGGVGSRLRPHTFDTPKPLLLMGSPDRRVIDNPLDISSDVSDRIWVSTDYLSEQVEEYLVDKPLISVLRDGRTVGSGGSLVEHYERFSDLESDGDLLILPSDHIYDGNFSLEKYLEKHRESGADITLMTVPAKSYGEYLKVDGDIGVSIERQAHLDSASTTGTYMFRNSFILGILQKMQQSERYDLNIYKDIVCPAVGQAAVTSFFISDSLGFWEDTGTHERFHKSNMRLSGGLNVISNLADIDKTVHLRRCVVLGNVILRNHIQIEDAIISSSPKGELRVTGLSVD